MPAVDRPRRSSRSKANLQSPTAETPIAKKAKLDRVEEKEEDFGLDDTDDSSDEDVTSKPWLKKKSSKPTGIAITEKTRDKTVIPKRNRDQTPPPAKEEFEIKLKKKPKEDRSSGPSISGDKGNVSSLIANMAPADKNKRQPAIRDWKSNEDYKEAVNARHNRSRSKVSNTPWKNQPPKEQKLPINVKANSASNPNIKQLEMKNKLQSDLNKLICNILENKPKKIASLLNDNMIVGDFKNKERIEKEKIADAIDWNGSFMPTGDGDKFDFGDLYTNTPPPIFPEDFKSNKKQWPLSWWGILSPSDELLDLHDDGSRSRRRRDRDRDRDREWDHERERDRERNPRSREREFNGNRDLGWREDRRGGDRHWGGNGGQPHRGEGHYGPPPGHFPPYGPGPGAPPNRGGGWQGQRHDDDWRGGGRGFGTGPGPGGPMHGGQGPGPGPSYGQGPGPGPGPGFGSRIPPFPRGRK